MEKLAEIITGFSKTTKYILCGVIAALIFVGVLATVFSGSKEVTIDIESTLKEIISTSTLRTSEYTYNSIAEVKDGDKTKYHVSYKGTVTAGFDFEEVEITQEGNTLCIVLPDVKIVEVIVDPRMDYIFVKKKYDTEETYAEATEACKKDLLKKAQENKTLLQTARESAKDTINALIKPFESRLDNGATVEIVFSAETEATAE